MPPITPPELSAGPTWASPPGFQASSMLPQGQRATQEARDPRTHCGPRWVPVVRARRASSPGRFSLWLWGTGWS